MNKKKEFGQGGIFTVCNYIWWFLLGNFYFWLMNIPYIFVGLVMSRSGDTQINLILILSLIPIGPALTALLSVMGKLIREGDINVTRDFFKAYKTNFFEALFFWTVGLVILLSIKIDIMIISRNSHLHFLNIVVTIACFICLSLALYIFPIISRFYLKKTDVLRLSAEYFIKKVHVCLITFIGIYLLLKISNGILGGIMLLFSASIISYGIMYLEKGILKDIEEKLPKTDCIESAE
jgi:uncharacterized membrane protein YesL